MAWKTMLVFLLGIVTGTVLMNFVAVRAMRGYLRNYVAVQHAEDEINAAKLRCRGETIREIVHRWRAAEDSSMMRRYEKEFELGSFSPFAFAILSPMSRTAVSDIDLVENVSKAKLAETLRRSGHEERAEEILAQVVVNKQIDVETINAMAKAQLDAECESSRDSSSAVRPDRVEDPPDASTNRVTPPPP